MPQPTASPGGLTDNAAFNNYLDSTGYKFQLGQGVQALTGSAAAKGILNSGSTAKAVVNYGQGMGSNYFDKYLTQLGHLSSNGLTATGQIGSAGTSGGGNAGQLTASAGQQQQTGISGAAGDIAGGITNYFSRIAPPSSAGADYMAANNWISQGTR